MRYAVTLPIGGPCSDPIFLLDLAIRAERAGWDGVFLEDYVVFQGDRAAPTTDPWTALAAIAVSTSTISLGTKVTPLARRRPWIVARQAATIDQLSKGRMILGAGLGDVNDHVTDDASFTAFAEELDARSRSQRLDEALDVIDRLWSGEVVSHHGRWFTVDDVIFEPRPVQRPRIPIWIGGGYPLPGPTTRASRWDGSMLYGADGQAMQAEDVAQLRRAAGDREYDIMVGIDNDRAGRTRNANDLRALEEAGATWGSLYVGVDTAEAMVASVERGPR